MVSEDHCMYVKKMNKGITFVTLCVDNILFDKSNLEMMEAATKWLSYVFVMKRLGEGNYVLGVKIVKNFPILSMSEEAYIKKILKCFPMYHSKPVDRPLEKG